MISKAALKRIALEQAREDALDQEFEMSLYTDDGTALAARLRPSSEYVTVSGDAAATADDTKVAMPPHRKSPSTDTATGAPAETLIAEDGNSSIGMRSDSRCYRLHVLYDIMSRCMTCSLHLSLILYAEREEEYLDSSGEPQVTINISCMLPQLQFLSGRVHSVL